jgi:tRNA threonylcarbamoyladenosine biosynthesis protein TsaB
MSECVELALCGSNLAGDLPFSCALRWPDGRRESAMSPPTARGDLIGLVAALCERHGVAPAAVQRLRLDLGPGSYTGLRVAVTFVRHLLQFGGAKAIVVDSLALLAARARATVAGRHVALLDARRGRLHCGVFTRDAGGAWQAAVPASAILQPSLDTLLQAGDHVVLPVALRPQLQPLLDARALAVTEVAAVRAEELFAADLPFASVAAADLLPRYLMASYAED